MKRAWLVQLSVTTGFLVLGWQQLGPFWEIYGYCFNEDDAARLLPVNCPGSHPRRD